MINKIIPEGEIEILVHFPGDPDVGINSTCYTLQAPDFRDGWTETEQMLEDYIEEKREQIQAIWGEFNADSMPQVSFSFENFGIEENEIDQMHRPPMFEELNKEHHEVIEHCKDLAEHGHKFQALAIYKEYTGCSVEKALQTLNITLQ